ncbi:polyamine aminopropyltransferase [cyanobiont of Ornithocercus magnificus]|nr:polyamine aminopropyltransferase [cyanobiont of Ornithocercus magnificus]
MTVTSSWVDEVHDGTRYGLHGRVITEEMSAFQRITVIDSDRYGRALLLDGCWMTAEHQERYYHEPLVHPALCCAITIERILIIGGGDGGTARQCLLYPDVKHLDLVEIDSRVIDLSRTYLPAIGSTAWEDPRLHLTVGDGTTWVADAATASYDVILVDGSDPTGPAKGLFSCSFLTQCRRLLKPGGIFATQSGSPEASCKFHQDIVSLTRDIFDYSDPLYGWVPMYPSGCWSWSFAAIGYPHYRNPQPERVANVADSCKIWSPRWQRGAFDAMPAFIERALKR